MSRACIRVAVCLLGALALTVGPAPLASGADWASYPTRIVVSEKFPALHGALHSASRSCRARRRLLVYRVNAHRRSPVGRGFSHRNGTWKVSLGEKLSPGHYYVVAPVRRSRRFHIYCPKARSKDVPVTRS